VRPPKRVSGFRKDVPRFVRAGMAWNLERHRWLDKQLNIAEEVFDRVSRVRNIVEGSGRFCIVTEGSAYNYVREVVDEVGVEARVVKLSLLFPPPRRFLAEAVEGCTDVLVIEELDPYLELVVKSLLSELGVSTRVFGKVSGHIPLEGELNRGLVREAIASLVSGAPSGTPKETQSKPIPGVPSRPPPMCPGCPHRSMYVAMLIGVSKAGYKRGEVPVFGDIGCYALASQPPLEAIWTEHSMGASISMAMGAKVAGFEGPVIAVIGDSTFYHAGIQPLIEAVHKRVDILVVVADNSVVAMTGHQSTPAWPALESGRRAKPVAIEDLLRAIGVDHVEVVDPYDVDRMVSAFERLIRQPGVKVLVSKHPCALLEARSRSVRRYRVVEDKCTGCLACIRVTGCPAMSYNGEKVVISSDDCAGCGLCARFCPYGAIEVVGSE